jgi:hypothetical protein
MLDTCCIWDCPCRAAITEDLTELVAELTADPLQDAQLPWDRRISVVMAIVSRGWSRDTLAIVFSQLTWPLPSSGTASSLLYIALVVRDYAHAALIVDWGVCVHAGMPSVVRPQPALLWTPLAVLMYDAGQDQSPEYAKMLAMLYARGAHPLLVGSCAAAYFPVEVQLTNPQHTARVLQWHRWCPRWARRQWLTLTREEGHVPEQWVRKSAYMGDA